MKDVLLPQDAEIAKVNGTVFLDSVAGGRLKVPQQAFGYIKSFQFLDARSKEHPLAGDGLVGFVGFDSSSFDPPATSWFGSLCNQSLISECRFGLTFGESTHTFGKIY